MSKMPTYDVTKGEQEIIDKIPEAVSTGDAQKMHMELRKLYLDNIGSGYDSALTITEKYLFRSYELLFFVNERGEDFDYEGFFFDEEIHNKILAEAMSVLNEEEAGINYTAGVMFIKMGEYEEAGKSFRRAALCGSIDGAYNLGVTVSRGEGCEADAIEGSFWYWFAACRGNAKAMYNLAYNYEKGIGLHPDGMNMLYWYLHAAIEGNREAAYCVGNSLVRGKGIPGLQMAGQQILRLVTFTSEENDKVLKDFYKMLIGNMEKYVYNRKF